MQKQICPYFRKKTLLKVDCQRGTVKANKSVKGKHKQKIKNHVNKHCSNKYTQCSNYQQLQGSW